MSHPLNWMWDGNPPGQSQPEVDVFRFYQEELPLTAESEQVDLSGTFNCGFCGEELPLILPSEGLPHRCFGAYAPGNVFPLGDGEFGLVLKSDAESIQFTRITNIEEVLSISDLPQ